MNRKIKRLLGLAIVLIMALAVMSVSALAADDVAKIGNETYANLAAAINAAKAGDTITFLADVTEDVTISKNLTIDGADYTYTGNMTLKADTTINNVNFDGKGYNGYAVETRGAQYLTIEDCTAKNYGYGFVQLASGTALTTVKDVTISNINYGVKVDYSNAVVLDNVDITANVAGVLNSNYGEKTITIKDSKINILGTWTRNDAIKTNIVFEGENTVDKFIIDTNIDVFKLAADATLATAASLEVTTDVEDSYVAYNNGVYTVVENAKAAEVNGKEYKTLAEAIKAATKGDTITLLSDVNESVTINKNLTIDGADKQYTGTMTLNTGLTVVVKNVNFVNGGFDKSKANKSTTGSYTIKDCTFDGEGEYAYPLRFYGANSIAVENCTVKDYLYSFLYVPSAAMNVTVKNVTVENCPNYAVYFASGVTNAKFENLTVKNSNNGFVINNTAIRKLTIKDCKMENVNTAIDHANGTKTITCTALGENDFGDAAFSQYVKLEAAAQIGTKFYGSLKAAVDAANDGDVITVVADHELDNATAEIADYDMYAYLTVSDKKITIDLNGKTITANPSFDKRFYGVIVVNGTGDVTLTDSSADKTGAINVTAVEGTEIYSMLSTDGNKSKLTIEDGNYYIDKVDKGYSMIYIAQTGTGYVTGGNFVLGNAKTIEREGGVMAPWIFNTAGNGVNFVEVTGGRYNTDPTHHWNEVKFKRGYVTVQAEDGMWKLVRGPVIVEQPTDITIGYNKMAHFAPEIKGDGLTYKWYYKDANTSWNTSTLTTSTYDIKGTASRDGRQVYCVATDCTGKSVRTEIATLHVVPNEELTIVKQPKVVEGELNKNVSVALDVEGDGLTYVWYYSDNGGKSYNKSSLTTATYDIILKEERMGRKVYCIITDAFGDTVKSDVITINAVQSIELKVLSAPVYQAVAVGKTAKITLDVQGEGLKYTWYYSLPGKTTFYKSSIADSEYKITLSADRVGRNVYCVITDAFGNSVQTETITLYAQ